MINISMMDMQIREILSHHVMQGRKLDRQMLAEGLVACGAIVGWCIGSISAHLRHNISNEIGTELQFDIRA